MNDMTIYSEIATGMVLVYGPKLTMAIVTLIIGLWIIGFISRRLRVAFDHA